MSAATPSRIYSDGSRLLIDVVGNPGDVKLYHAMVTEHIRGLEEEAQMLKHCYNAVTPVNRLPPEILSAIFSLAVAKTVIRGGAHRALPWARITHVCRRWRTVALDCPSLWAHLQFGNPLFTQVMLERSGAAPLTVTVPDEDHIHRFESVLSIALSQLDRLRAVEYSTPHPLSDTRWQPMPGFTSISQWKGCAPILESLVLDQNSSKATKERLPLDWIQGKAPMLRVLCIRLCGVTWESAPLGSKLTSLTSKKRVVVTLTGHLRRVLSHRWLKCRFCASSASKASRLGYRSHLTQSRTSRSRCHISPSWRSTTLPNTLPFFFG